MSKEEEKSTVEEEVLEENLPPSIIFEDNEKVRKVMKTLEDWGWHPGTQYKVKLYIDTAHNHKIIVSFDKDHKPYNERTPFKYLHYELSEELFRYQHAVGTAIRNEDYSFSIRKKLIMFLGPKCVFCGTEDIDYLQLDHKSGYGGIERRRFKRNGLSLMYYYWTNLIEAYLRLQVLCIKCHRLKSADRILQSEIDEKIKQETAEKPKPVEAKT